jgi:hypothetical protein
LPMRWAETSAKAGRSESGSPDSQSGMGSLQVFPNFRLIARYPTSPLGCEKGTLRKHPCHVSHIG